MNERRRRFTCIARGKAKFNAGGKRWTSDVAWARVRYIPEEDEIRFCQVWKQKSKTANGEWSKPCFTAFGYGQLKGIDEFPQIQQTTAYAKRQWQKKKDRTCIPDEDVEPSKDHLRGHKQDLCERCQELRRPCYQRTPKTVQFTVTI